MSRLELGHHHISRALPVSVAGSSSSVSTLHFANSNGVSFAIASNSVIVASISAGAAQTNQTVGIYASSNTTLTSSGTFDARSMTVRGIGNVSVGYSNGEMVISGSGGGGGLTNIKVSAGAASNLLSDVTFANSNGISFGLNASTITASHNALTSQSNQAFSAEGGSSAFQTISFGNANGLSFINSNGSVQASYTVPTITNSSWSVSDSATSLTISRLAFTVSNGLTFTLSTGAGAATVIGSYTVPTVTNSSWTVSDAATSVSVSRLAFTNANGLTLTLSTGAGAATVVGSYTVPSVPAQTNEAAAGQNGSFTFNTLSFSNANGISFGTSAGPALTASHNALVTQSTQFLAVTLGGNSAGTNTFHATNNASLFLNGGNNITLSGNGSTITIVGAAGGPGGGGTASHWAYPEAVMNSSAWQVSGSTKHVQPVFIPYDISASYIRIPLTLSIPGSMAAVATAANATRGLTVSSTFYVQIMSQNVGASSRSLAHYASGSATWVQRATLQAAGVGSNWSSGHTLSYPFEGGYSETTVSAGATSASLTMQSTQLSNFTALRCLDIPFATSLSAGNYWFVYNSSTSISTSGTANISTVRILASNFVVTQPNQAINCLGRATNSSNHFRIGLGSWTTNAITTTASMALASISTSASHPVMPFQIVRQA